MPEGLSTHVDLTHPSLTPEKPRQSRASKVTASERPHRAVPHTVPGFSIEMLGRQLALAEHRDHLLDILRHEGGPEVKGLAFECTPARLRQRHVAAAAAATSDHLYALQDLILASRPETVADVVVQIMVCCTYTDRMWGTAEGAESSKALAIVDRVLRGAVRCLAAQRSISLAELSGAANACVSADPWPDVDLGVVANDLSPEWDAAMDGSLTEWQR